MFKSSYVGPLTLALALGVLGTPNLAQAQAKFNYWVMNDTVSHAPKTLSATGLYLDIASAKKRLLPNAYHFEVNAALWSDGAKKKRWVLVPPGKQITYYDTVDYYDYPDSTVFIKQFAIDTIAGDSNSRVLWETRLLINRKEFQDPDAAVKVLVDKWYGFSYKWNADQKDAKLVEATYSGMNDSIKVWPNGLTKPSRMKKWVFPSANLCEQCHQTGMGYSTPALHARSVLGFFTAQLNRPHPDTAGINQLEYFFAKGILKGTKPVNWNDTAKGKVPRWFPISDAAAPIDKRARAYIAANCSGCHGTRGNGVGAAAMCNLNLDFHTMKPAMELRHKYASSRGLDTLEPKYYPKIGDPNNPTGLDSIEILPAIVVPGYPQKSLVVFRQSQRNETPNDFGGNFNQMPPLATFEVDVTAMDTLKKWITTIQPMLAPNEIRAVFNHRNPTPDAFLQGRRLLISKVGVQMKVSMSAVNGRKVFLQRTSEGVYSVPLDVPKGLYLIKVGSTSLLRYLL